MFVFFFSSRRRHTRCGRDWSSDVCSSDLGGHPDPEDLPGRQAAGRPRHAGFQRSPATTAANGGAVAETYSSGPSLVFRMACVWPGRTSTAAPSATSRSSPSTIITPWPRTTTYTWSLSGCACSACWLPGSPTTHVTLSRPDPDSGDAIRNETWPPRSSRGHSLRSRTSIREMLRAGSPQPAHRFLSLGAAEVQGELEHAVVVGRDRAEAWIRDVPVGEGDGNRPRHLEPLARNIGRSPRTSPTS